MTRALMLQWGLPVFGLAFGVVGYLWLRHEGHRLDRKYGPDA